MNINIASMPGIHDSFAMAAASDITNREVTQPVINQENLRSQRENKEFRQAITEAVTMDTAEVREFLFMLIGASVQVRPEITNTGSRINMTA